MKYDWSRVPFGTMFQRNDCKYVFLRYMKNESYPIRCICEEDLEEDGLKECTEIIFVNPEDNEKYAIKKPKKVTKYFCHCGEKLKVNKDRKNVVRNDNGQLVAILSINKANCKKCGLVYEGKTCGIPKEVEE